MRPAAVPDITWLVENDGHLDSDAIAGKLASQEVLVAEIGGQRVGLLRLDHLWSTIPFVALVRVSEPFRRQGVGLALVRGAAERGRARGASLLLSSATAGEAGPQAWHRAVGFEPCGELAGINEDGAGELFFRLTL